MNPFEPRPQLDSRVAHLLEQMEAVTKARIFGLTQRDAESAQMRESWVTLTQLLERGAPAINVPAAVAAIEDRLSARRRRRSHWWLGGVAGLAAAACLVFALWPDVAAPRKRVALDDEVAGVFDGATESPETAPPFRLWRDEVDFALLVIRDRAEEFDADFHQSPTEIAHVASVANALERELEESTL